MQEQQNTQLSLSSFASGSDFRRASQLISTSSSTSSLAHQNPDHFPSNPHFLPPIHQPQHHPQSTILHQQQITTVIEENQEEEDCDGDAQFHDVFAQYDPEQQQQQQLEHAQRQEHQESLSDEFETSYQHPHHHGSGSSYQLQPSSSILSPSDGALGSSSSNEEENLREEGNDSLRDNRAQVLARMLRSYYMRMRRTMNVIEQQDNDEYGSHEEAIVRRPRSRIGISRTFDTDDVEGFNTAALRTSRIGSNEDDEQYQHQLTIENYFHRRSAAHPPRQQNSISEQYTFSRDHYDEFSPTYSQSQTTDSESKASNNRADFEKLKDLVPKFWFDEISSEISKSQMKILELYGPLSVLLYTRIEKLPKQRDNSLSEDIMFDLCLLNLKMNGMKFIQRVLAFFSNNMREASTNQKCRIKVDKLIKVIPPAKQMIKVLKQKKLSEREKLIYKVVVDMLEIYYREFDGPRYKTYLNQIIPLGLAVYQQIENNDQLKRINNHIKIQSIFYRQFTIKNSKEDYLDYYEDQQMKLGNLVHKTKRQDFVMM